EAGEDAILVQAPDFLRAAFDDDVAEGHLAVAAERHARAAAHGKNGGAVEGFHERKAYLGNETGIFKTTCKPHAIQSRTLSAERSPARKGSVEIDLHLGAEPAGVRALAGADGVVQRAEGLRETDARPDGAPVKPERELRVAPPSLDVERAARALPIVAHLCRF